MADQPVTAIAGSAKGGRDNPDPNHPIPIPHFRPGRDKGDGGGPHYSSWLLLRTQAGDTGWRPLAPGAVFWESPDVWTVGSKGINQPVVGEPTQVWARVGNLGLMDATGVTLNYWWADPSLAITTATAHLIATDTVDIPAGNTLVFRSPQDWVPVNVNQGHECLIVEAYIPAFDGLTAPMLPALDRHVGQKNEQLLVLPVGQSFHFRFNAVNFSAEAQELTVEWHGGTLPAGLAERYSAARGLPARLFDAALPIAGALHISDEAHGHVPVPYRTQARAAAVDTSGCMARPLARMSRRFAPGEIRRVTLAGALPRNAAAGEVFTVRIAQRLHGVIAGGYTLYLTRRPDPEHPVACR